MADKYLADVREKVQGFKQKANETYSFTLNTFLCVGQAYVLDDSLLAVVQVLGLGHMKTFSLCILTDHIVGPAHALNPSLKITNI